MSEGLKPHRHQYYEHKVYRDYRKKVVHVTYRCMICGKEYHDRYEYQPPPRKEKSCKTLEKHKRKYGNR